ncbi:MAG: hypothetical protein AB7O66_15715 [Limisphaerales bacterium]
MTNAPTSIVVPGPSPVPGPVPGADGLRDIAGPVPVTSLAAQLLFWGTLAALLALAAYLARRWWRRRQALQAQGPPPPPPLPPHVVARLRLEKALGLLGDPDRFCTEVSSALRDYLEGRFGWNAPDRTTEEFLAELRTREGLSESIQKLIQDFLTRCDFVKFARYDPSEPELLEIHQAAVRMVEDTVPPPLPVDPDVFPRESRSGRDASPNTSEPA